MHLVNMAWPSDQMPCMTLRAWPGYDLRITFGNQSVLSLFCDECEDDYDNYTFGGVVSVEERKGEE